MASRPENHSSIYMAAFAWVVPLPAGRCIIGTINIRYESLYIKSSSRDRIIYIGKRSNADQAGRCASCGARADTVFTGYIESAIIRYQQPAGSNCRGRAARGGVAAAEQLVAFDDVFRSYADPLRVSSYRGDSKNEGGGWLRGHLFLPNDPVQEAPLRHASCRWPESAARPTSIVWLPGREPSHPQGGR